MVISYHGTDQPNAVRTWRGQRYLTCRCSDCGQNFYSEAGAGPADEAMDDRIIDDEEALKAAEDELKKEADDEGDHRLKGG